MTLRLRVGKKGYIILPKAIREAVGIDEGDELIVEVRDAIILKPARRVNRRNLRAALRNHLSKIMDMPSSEPKPGELAEVYLEEEFER